MFQTPLTKVARWLAVAAGVSVLLLAGVGTAAAEDGELPAPIIIPGTDGSFPKCINVKWQDPPQSLVQIAGFTVKRVNPAWGTEVGPAIHNALTPCDMEPGTTAGFEVCVLYANEDGDEECAEADLSTLGPVEEAPQRSLPTPTITGHDKGPDFIGIKWEGHQEYDWYFINCRRQGGQVCDKKHDDDGTWGYQRFDGLSPGDTYEFTVQGCVDGLLGNPCSAWSAPLNVTTDAHPASGCPKFKFPGDLSLTQSDGWTLQTSASGQELFGYPTAAKADGSGKISGTVIGGIRGYTVDFKVAWGNGHASHYYGDINPDGTVTKGERDDIREQGAVDDKTTWHLNGALTCVG